MWRSKGRSKADNDDSVVKPVHLRVYVGFTEPPQTVVVNADTRWNVDSVRVLVVDLLVRKGCELTSAQPFDYTLRFQAPEEKVYIPKEASRISAPGLVLEKSQDLLDREARLKAERDEAKQRAQAELEAREKEQSEYERHRRAYEEAIRKEAQQRRLRQERLNLIQERRERNVLQFEHQDQQKELTEVQHCERWELHRRLQWAADRAPRTIARHLVKYPPPRPLTKTQLLMARLEDDILRAAEAENGFTEQWGYSTGSSVIPLSLCCPPSDPFKLTQSSLSTIDLVPPSKAALSCSSLC